MVAWRSMWMASSFHPNTTVWFFSITAELDVFMSSIQVFTSLVMRPAHRENGVDRKGEE
jgi:hypothetical protein